MNEPTPRILVVDDDAELRALVSDFLQGSGFQVDSAADGMAMDRAMAETRYDLLVLDQMMPGEDGLSILRRLRGGAAAPGIIMLSAMGEDTDRIIGLEVGADDYLPKPCNPRELLARVRAVLRRRATPADAPLGKVRRFGGWALDIVQRQLARPGAAPVGLTDAEFRTLNAFLDRPLRVLTRDQLIDHARGLGSDVFDRAIDVTISRLRKKLAPDDPIRTVRNEGYMFTMKVDG